MSQATSTRNSNPSKLPSSASPATPPFHHLPVEDIELDDGLDDHELSDNNSDNSELPANKRNMGSLYRKDDNASGDGGGGAKKMSEVANAISSCLALSFFSISMILANKVRYVREWIRNQSWMLDGCRGGLAGWLPVRGLVDWFCVPAGFVLREE